MARTQNLGGVFTTDTDGNIVSSTVVSTENVVGLIFDTKIAGGFAAALGSTGTAATTFANGNVVEVNSMKDVEAAGITSSVFGGLPHYHLNQFFQLAGNGCRLFISFMDSTSDTNFNAVEKMQLAANGIIYQIGVWTGEALGTVSGTGSSKTVTLGENNVITKLQAQAEALGGHIGVTNYDGNAPVSILLNCPVANVAELDYQILPDLTTLDCPKVSMLIGQSSSSECHNVQLAVNHLNTTEGATATYAPVGNVGAALACLAVAPASESIAHVESFNLSRVISDAELGFGNLTYTVSNAWSDSVSFTNIKTLNYTKRNTKLHQKGYIFLTNYDGLENSIFFSSDQTLSVGDYRTISRCRVMHKSRRVIRQALLPYVNASVEVDTTTGYISTSVIETFKNIVLNALDNSMVNPGTAIPQISGRSCTIAENQAILENDQLLIDYALIPLGTTSVISVTEGFSATA